VPEINTNISVKCISRKGIKDLVMRRVRYDKVQRLI
jgi:hypothetical protein